MTIGWVALDVHGRVLCGPYPSIEEAVEQSEAVLLPRGYKSHSLVYGNLNDLGLRFYEQRTYKRPLRPYRRVA